MKGTARKEEKEFSKRMKGTARKEEKEHSKVMKGTARKEEKEHSKRMKGTTRKKRNFSKGTKKLLRGRKSCKRCEIGELEVTEKKVKVGK